MADGGRDPAKLLRWIIKETAEPHYANNPEPADGDKESIPVTRMADLDDSERQKWRDIILGQTSDILNNRASLQEAIRKLHTLKGTVQPTSDPITRPHPLQSISENKETDDTVNDSTTDDPNEESSDDPNEEIKVCLSIIHNLLDKNEAVLAKLQGVPLLLELIGDSVDCDNEICLDSCTILHDATQNNPMMQNHLYSQRGIQMVLDTLKKCSKHNYPIRAKLWALIHVMSRGHNPNFNVFLTHSGHHEINRILRIEQNSYFPFCFLSPCTSCGRGSICDEGDMLK